MVQAQSLTYSVDSTEPIEILQITDPHLFAQQSGQLLGVTTAESLHAVLDTVLANQHQAKLALITGDISQDFSPESYQYFAKAAKKLQLPCHHLPGNHDEAAVMNANIVGEYMCPQKRILIGNWQILLLDTTVAGIPGGYLPDSEVAFIEASIASAPDLHTLLVMHHNPIKVGCQWLDQHWMKNGDAFIHTVRRFPQIKGLVWGHVHQEIDKLVKTGMKAIRVIATPSTCIQFKPHCDDFTLDHLQPGYRLLQLASDGSISTQVYRVPGERFMPELNASGY